MIKIFARACVNTRACVRVKENHYSQMEKKIMCESITNRRRRRRRLFVSLLHMFIIII